MAAAAALGLGVAQLPDYMVEDLIAAGRLVELMRPYRPPPMPISAVYLAGRLVPRRIRVLLDALGELPRR